MKRSYKIEIEEIIQRSYDMEAEDSEKALEIIRKQYVKSDLSDFKNEELVEVDAKIIEENGELLEDICEDDMFAVDEEIYTNLEEIDDKLDEIDDELDDMEDRISDIEIKQKWMEENMETIAKFVENQVNAYEKLEMDFI